MLKGTKKKIRLDSGIGIKPISITGSKRLVRAAIEYALKSGRKTVTLVHKGNIQKFTEGAFREWGYEVASQEFRAQTVTERESWILGNLEANPNLTPEENAALIEPGIEFAAKEFGEGVVAEVKEVLAISPTLRQHRLEDLELLQAETSAMVSRSSKRRTERLRSMPIRTSSTPAASCSRA